MVTHPDMMRALTASRLREDPTKAGERFSPFDLVGGTHCFNAQALPFHVRTPPRPKWKARPSPRGAKFNKVLKNQGKNNSVLLGHSV